MVGVELVRLRRHSTTASQTIRRRKSYPTAAMMASAASPGAPGEIVVAHVVLGLHTTNDRLEGGASLQLTADRRGDPALLARDRASGPR